jgi:hypothetical protein
MHEGDEDNNDGLNFNNQENIDETEAQDGEYLLRIKYCRSY